MVEPKPLPNPRRTVTHKSALCGTEFYVTVTMENGEPIEVFLKIAKQGSDLAGWAQACMIMMSLALRSGVPWSRLRDRLLGMRFGSIFDDENPSLLHKIIAEIDSLRSPSPESGSSS